MSSEKMLRVVEFLGAGDRVSRHYRSRTAIIQQRFEDIRHLLDSHQGAKGTRVEKLVRDTLVEFLPGIFEYGTGIVVDSSGNEVDRSRQEDVLVLDKTFNPRLFLDEEPGVYPVETVYAGIEVKTILDATEFSNAVRNIASLKSLKPIQDQIDTIRGNTLISGKLQPPQGVVFAFDSRSRDLGTLIEQAKRASDGFPPEVLPSMFCILNRGIISFREGGVPRINVFGLLGKSESGKVGEVIDGSGKPHFDLEGKRYPTVVLDGRTYVVDPSRVFLNFLNVLLRLMQVKLMPENANFLLHYLPKEMQQTIVYP